MSIFKKLFGTKKEGSALELPKQHSKYMPEIKIPADEKFTINFRKNGGKFLYCDSNEEVAEAFQNIIKENEWTGKQALCLNDDLKDKFKSFDLKFTKKNQGSSFLFSQCEYLIADDGGILLCSKQIKENRLQNLPTNFVIYATTSQLVESISEGLRLIKSENRKKLPSNITTIKHFETQKEKDFLSYGSSSKNLYLLLFEDL